jgi:hypothetical protein
MKRSMGLALLLGLLVTLGGGAALAQDAAPTAATPLPARARGEAPAAGVAAPAAGPAAEAPLTNADVVKLCKLDLGDEVVIAKIDEARVVDFKLDTDGLVALKQDGLSKDVITAMLKRAAAVDGNVRKLGAQQPRSKVLLVGIGSPPPAVQSVLDALTDFLSEKGVPVKQIDLGQKSRQDYIDYAGAQGAESLLYVTLDVGMGQFKDRMKLQCFDAHGKELWEEESGSTVSFSTTGAVKKLLRGMEERLAPRVGNQGLPKG